MKDNKASEKLERKLFWITNPKTKIFYLKEVYKQITTDIRDNKAKGEFRTFIELAPEKEKTGFIVDVVFFMDKYGLTNHAKRLALQNKGDVFAYYNDFIFNPENAKGLKEELLSRNGREHLFRVGKAKNVSIPGKGWKRTDYPILMDGKKIGRLTTVTESNHFTNTVYEGRIPGYVNSLIESSIKHRNNYSNLSVDEVILQCTEQERKDGHWRLKFTDSFEKGQYSFF